jgi:DNA-binding Lrp family transcriptional regulator
MVELGTEKRAGRRIAELNGVREVYELSGDIDIIAKVEAQDTSLLSKTITKIRAIDGVEGTDTRIILTTF